MLFPYVDKETPFVLSPESLDWYLSRGWYRMGGHIFTTHFLFFNDSPYSAVWIRQDLTVHTFSRSQRKLMRKNAKLFEIATGPRVIDEEREELYLRYADNFDGRLSPTIAESLEDFGDSTSIFNTWETTIRDKVSGKLVGISYFDLGDDSAASILGIYDPLLSSFSLGYYTMLLEMDFCRSRGVDYYYPGYVVPGYKRFDYKLRLGFNEYYDLRSESWLPYNREEIDVYGPVESQQRKLKDLASLLHPEGPAGTGLYIYPLFEAKLYDPSTDNYLAYPYFVPLGRDSENTLVLVTYDPSEEVFLVLHCSLVRNAMLSFKLSHLNESTESNYFTDLLQVEKLLLRGKSIEAIYGLLLQASQKANS
ncbi:arginine-tRNA-protein transferase [Neolewinella aurantiaca]|uniref:Arginine-tRNA-protein transferase n=1 Tax=Neolewinella aurantiaca TaxID=2602767 RepID=A0A5C7FC96_9BACT|nr:arginine-tRNA-protein transferase [Neolewinella aurantiaca]TXF88560.1 arginine-tRNA-protein transferase [Neolewinella aurantiaca]